MPVGLPLLVPGMNKGRVDKFVSTLRQIAGAFPFVVWPMTESSGSIAYDLSGNGIHGNYLECVLGTSPGFGAGRKAATFVPANNGANGSYVDFIGTGLNTIFQQGLTTGTLGCAGKISSATWAENASGSRRLITLQVNTNNIIHLRKDSNSDIFGFSHSGGGTGKQVLANSTSSPFSTYRTNFIMYIMTYDTVTDVNVRGFANGVEVAESPTASPVNMTGNLDLTISPVGNRRTNTGAGIYAPFDGPLNVAFFIAGKACSAAEVARLSVAV